MLELTTTFRNVSTAGGRSAADASGAAAAHLRYIDRDTAVEDRASSGLRDGTREDQLAEMRNRFRHAAEKGGKNGARVAEKVIVSLPNSWDRDARQEAAQRLCELFAPAGSDGFAYAVTHADKPDNRHLHIIAQDGAESVAQAKARRLASSRAWAAENGGKKPRLRRQNVLRLGDKRRAKEVRAEIAGVLNQIAAERGIDAVEYRSFKDRGIDQPATVHEGASVRAVAEKTGRDPSGRIAANKRIRAARAQLFSSTASMVSGKQLDELFGDPTPPAPQRAPQAPQAAKEPDRAERRRQERSERIRAAAEQEMAERAARQARRQKRDRGRER